MILPTLARHHVNREDNSSQSVVDFRNTMDWGVRMILLLGVPAAIGIAVLAQPMLLVLFMRGSFYFNRCARSLLFFMGIQCGFT